MIMHNTLLGPYGKATVVLFTSQFETQLPKLGELKKRLGVTDGKFYLSNGNFMHSIASLDEAIATKRNVPNPMGLNLHAVSCTHIFLTVADVHPELFALVKYSAELLEGFNLTDLAFKQLNDLLHRRREIAWMRNECSDWAKTLTEQIAKANEMGLTDRSILDVDVNAVSTMTQPYALEAIAQANAEIISWYDRYRWRTAKTVANNLADLAGSDLSPEIVDEQMA